MKNVTITLDEQVASWARVEAARAGKSLSRFVSDMLVEHRNRPANQRESLKRFIDAPDFPGVTADLVSREELYAERLFHRYKHSPVHKGSGEPVKAGKSARMARRPRR